METISQEEFKKRYGSVNLEAFKVMEKKRSTLSDVAIGAAKGLTETAVGTANMLVEGGRFIQGAITPGKTTQDFQREAATGKGSLFAGKTEQGIQDRLKAANTAQKIGKVGAFAGEVLSPLAPRVAATTLTKGKKIAEEISDFADPKKARSLVKDLRFALSDVDPQAETVLKRSSFDEVNKYFQQARNAKADPAKATPLELAGQKAEEAFDVVSRSLRDATQSKKEMIAEVGNRTLYGNPAGNALDVLKTDVVDRFGVQIGKNGELTTIPGRVSKLDAPSQALLNEYVTKLRTLGPRPTAQQMDDFVDWAQGQLYKQSKEVSKLQSADDATVGYLKSLTEQINGDLKTQIGGGYSEINARVSRLIDLQDELNRALGADARKGGGLMKKLFSPTGGDTRRIFAQIEEETGIDLVKEATLAKFAMEGVGDVRQQSLLKSLDVAADKASRFNLTEPGSWYKTFREFADLDDQELANELIRRAGQSE